MKERMEEKTITEVQNFTYMKRRDPLSELFQTQLITIAF
jgi:hypothetical protein